MSQRTDGPTIIDWHRTARRLRTVLTGLGILVIVAWIAHGIASDGLDLRALAELAGIGLLVAFVLEAVIVGGCAIRGLMAAGARGDRLAGDDVSLLPPQLSRRRRRS